MTGLAFFCCLPEQIGLLIVIIAPVFYAVRIYGHAAFGKRQKGANFNETFYDTSRRDNMES